MTVLIVVRSILFMVAGTLLTIAFGVPILCSLLFGYRFGYWLVQRYTRCVIKAAEWICQIRWVLEGSEHIQHGGAVVMSRHESAWETVFLVAHFPPQVWIIKRELIWVPIIGQCLWVLKGVFVDRRSGKQAREQVVVEGRDRLSQGLNMTVFPEGTRVAPREKRRFKLGGFLLASAAGAPIVPVAHNAGDCWQRNAFIKRPGTVRVIVGPLISTAGKTAEQAMAETEHWINATQATLRNAVTSESITSDAAPA